MRSTKTTRVHVKFFTLREYQRSPKTGSARKFRLSGWHTPCDGIGQRPKRPKDKSLAPDLFGVIDPNQVKSTRDPKGVLMKLRTYTILFWLSVILLLVAAEAVVAQKTVSGGQISRSVTKLTTGTAQLMAETDLYGQVVFTGSGYAAFEPVAVSVAFAEGEIDIVVGQWVAMSDATGRVSSKWTMPDLAGHYHAHAAGGQSQLAADTYFYGPEIVTAAAANLDQCGNGPLGNPQQCTGVNWINGNLNHTKAHYLEGEVIPYRLLFDGLDTAVPHRVTIEWDTTEQGLHALDYITSFFESETDALPCSGVIGCDPTVFSTFDIPIDSWVANGFDGYPGTADDIVQIPGVLTLYGGTITGVSSDYMRKGLYSGSSQTSLTIFFTANIPNPVLAWGGHISTRADWGTGNSAISIDGSPYHMRLLDLDGTGGNQDMSLSSSATLFPGRIFIIKDTQPNRLTPFTFTATGQPGVSDFTLDDDGDANNAYSNTQLFDHLTYFGTGDRVTVIEGSHTMYSLDAINCTSDPNGGGGTNNNVYDLPAGRVDITLEEGEIVTCTFVNQYIGPTAGNAVISGRVIDAMGLPIPGTVIRVVRAKNGEIRTTRTGSFGYYMVGGLDAGEGYFVTVANRRFIFEPATVFVDVKDNVAGLDFQAQK